MTIFFGREETRFEDVNGKALKRETDCFDYIEILGGKQQRRKRGPGSHAQVHGIFADVKACIAERGGAGLNSVHDNVGLEAKK